MTTNGSTIHRHLDAAFAGVPLSPDAQDLKEEIRGNLLARAAELEAAGASPAKAAQAAIKELGPIDSLLEHLGGEGNLRESAASAYLRNKVRPRPRFVFRTVVLSAAAAMAASFTALAATGVLSWNVSVQVAVAIVGVAVPMGVLIADALLQETTANYPLSRGRAARYGVAAFLGLTGLALGLAIADEPGSRWPLFVGAPLLVTAGLVFTYLGLTQTNRRKAWVREIARRHTATSRFEQDPAAAARFGMYAGAVWMVAIAAFVVVTLTVGALWASLSFLAAIVATMVLLARMEFVPGSGGER